MKLIREFMLILGMLFLAFTSFSQIQKDRTISIFDELTYQEEVEVTLELDMENVFGNRRTKEKFPAVFSFHDENGKMKTWNIKVNVRGRFRRTRCENLPPLKLNFKKSELLKSGLAKFDDMKLVTFCVNDNKEAKQLVAKEYLAYKLYNELSDKSFRVQFLKINYKDVVSGKILTQHGFVIEDAAQLRNRLKVEKTDIVYNNPKERFEMNTIQTLSVFQYMIGNTDWSIDRSHNVKIYQEEEYKLAIPYDFDFSGFVDAPYVMIDNRKLKIKTNKERVYLGFDKNQKNLNSTLNYFLSKKEDLIKVIKQSKLLNRKSKRELTKYLNSFFEDMYIINFSTETFKTPSLR